MVDIDRLGREIVGRLKPLDPEQIILFGSYARGDAGEESDLDLYVVTHDDFTPANWRENGNIYLQYARPLRELQKTVAIDLITHTRPMNRKFREMGSSFSREVLEEGKVLYVR